jgi:peptidoglycan/xylan/chitin deacetylase (PgdA/CDA1 family)
MRRVVALEFHDVAPEPADGAHPAVSHFQLRAREFERTLTELRQLGCQTVSSRAFRAWQRGQGSLPERAVVLTFDDGHASHFDLVAPLLLRHRFTGTFFITVDRVGRPGWVTWDQLRKLVFLGMEIGSRGMSRESFAALSRAELARELTRSKELLEAQLGVPVRALAAPSGQWSAGVASAARSAGFDALWISTPGTNGFETQAMALRRLAVRRPPSLQQMLALADGWQPAFWWVARQQVAIRGLKRILGVYWYEQLKRRLVPNA